MLAFLPSVGMAQEGRQTTQLGMTPNHVYSLWTNINEGLLAVAEIASGDATWDREVSSLDRRSFTGKVPADVLREAAEFRDRLNQLRERARMPPATAFRETGTVVTPSDVFVNSGYMLDGVVDWIIEMTPPQRLISGFYLLDTFDGKGPGDVYSLVELAVRRLDLVLASVGR